MELTIRELKKKIQDLPDNMKVCIGERVTEYDFAVVNTANIQPVYEWNGNELHQPEEVFVLSED